MMRDALGLISRRVWLSAAVTGLLCAISGLFVGLYASEMGRDVGTLAMFTSAGFFGGVVIACWLLGLGYVYADAEQRGMRRLPWLFIAMLVPHLLGFLLYFALRQPVMQNCAGCGSGMSKSQRFCSVCGCAREGHGAQAQPEFGGTVS